MKSSIVAKVGGSLFDLPDLRERLLGWVKKQRDCPILFVPGGGAATDLIRKLDTIHQFGEEKSHWLAIRMMSANAYFLADLLDLAVVTSPPLLLGVRGEMQVAVLDPLHFCETDSLLEHSWRVTSDSIAARVAIAIEGDLMLLKSADLPSGKSWRDASDVALLDEFFPTLVESSGLSVTWVNLRGTDATRRQ